MFASEEAQATYASKTFEPDEDLAAAQQQAGVAPPQENGDEQQQEGQGPAQDGAEAAPARATAAPSQEQLIAIKAAIANAQTLEEIHR
jgi:U2 small nuclear ribonucleoprotein A'